MDVLDRYPDMTIKAIAKQLGVCYNTAHLWLTKLGAARVYQADDTPKLQPGIEICSRCGIILSEAPGGSNGECFDCLLDREYESQLEADNPTRTPHYVIDIAPMILVEERIGI